jgi:hypothetical protein
MGVAVGVTVRAPAEAVAVVEAAAATLAVVVGVGEGLALAVVVGVGVALANTAATGEAARARVALGAASAVPRAATVPKKSGVGVTPAGCSGGEVARGGLVGLGGPVARAMVGLGEGVRLAGTVAVGPLAALRRRK